MAEMPKKRVFRTVCQRCGEIVSYRTRRPRYCSVCLPRVLREQRMEKYWAQKKVEAGEPEAIVNGRELRGKSTGSPVVPKGQP